jgi:plasmid stabilization system protein ParE
VNVRYTPGAARQISEAIDRIAEDDPTTANRFSAHIERLGQLILRHTDIGRKTSATGVRVLPAKPYPYLIFYRSRGEAGVEIIRVRHMARKQDWRRGR